jgi:hypothetical protein
LGLFAVGLAIHLVRVTTGRILHRPEFESSNRSCSLVVSSVDVVEYGVSYFFHLGR